VRNSSIDPEYGYTLLRPVTTEITVRDEIVYTYHILDHLEPGSYYLIKVYAENNKGSGPAGERIIRTKPG